MRRHWWWGLAPVTLRRGPSRRSPKELAEVQTTVGYVAFLLSQIASVAEAAFRRAIALDPRYAATHRYLGHLLSQMGEHEEAAAVMQRARDVEPLEPIHHALSSQVAFQARDYSAAVEHARQALNVNLQLWIAHIEVAQAYNSLARAQWRLTRSRTPGVFRNATVNHSRWGICWRSWGGPTRPGTY